MHIHHSPRSAFASVQPLPEAAWWLPAVAVPLDDTAVVKACVLGVDVVLWRIDGHWCAALDQCPHRGAALSAGCVVGNALQCPYHGWRFDAQGVCAVIPAVPAFTPPLGHGLTTCAAQVYGGMVWVQLRASADAIPPSELYPEHTIALQRAGMLHVLTAAYEVQASAPRVVENFLDMSHFGTVHEGWLGDAEHTAVLPYRVEHSPNRARALGVRAWQPRSQVTLTQGAWVDYRYAVAHPYCAQLTKLPSVPGGVEESIAMWVCPMSPHASRVWFSLCMADQGQTVTAVQAFQDTIFRQDKPVLESQRPLALPLDRAAEKHSAVDGLSAAYRELLRAWQISYGTCSI